MKNLLLTTALCLAGLAGCASKPPTVSTVAPPPALATAPAPAGSVPAPARAAPVAPGAPAPVAAAPVPPRASLAAEQKRLAELFNGTPVVFSMQADGSMKVDVPLSFCFDHGAFVVKPPLAAVLDRLARSQRSSTTNLTVSAAGDTATRRPNLARDRAASMRDYMVARGVLATRVMLDSGAPDDGVEIVVSEDAAEKR